MPHPLQILIVEDRPARATAMVRALRRAGFDPAWTRVHIEADFLAHLRPGLDVILTGYSKRGFSGRRALEILGEQGAVVPLIVISEVPGVKAAVEAMKLGARDYLRKSELSALGKAVEDALGQAKIGPIERPFAHRPAFSNEVMNSLTAEVVVINDSGEIIAFNDAWVRFGRENAGSDFLGVNYLSVCEKGQGFSSPDSVSAARGIRSVLDGSAPYFVMEYPCHSKFEQRWFQMRVDPLHGLERGAVITHEKITERKRVAEALSLFRNLVDHSIDTIEIVDPVTARFLDVNATGCASLGYTREEYLSMRVFDIDPGVTEDNWPERAAHIRAAGSITVDTLHRHRRDGSSIPVEIIARCVRLDRDYIVAVVRDISERRKAEERLREQAAMLDLASDAIIVRGLEDRQISFWSKGAENLYGWTAEEARGGDVAELIFQDPSAPIAIRNAMMKTNDWRGESRHKTKDGKPLLVSTRATLVRDSAGVPKSVLSINTDITEQRKLETRYQRAQRMEAIGSMVGGVAHDLGNIVAPISIAAAALRGQLSETTREELVSSIQQAAEHGIQIIRRILSFGRRQPADMRPTRIGPMIADVMKFIHNTFPANIRIETALEPGLWAVMGDAAQLYQVFLNLCLNAQDAMRNGGKLRLHARNLKVNAASVGAYSDLKPGDFVMLEVSDTGTGIAAENVEHVFEPFFTTKPMGKGTGLGLSTALAIVQSHGGSIDLKTESGVGSAFQVYLPASTHRPLTPRKPGRARPPRGHGESILVVDDEAGVRKITRISLESAGYRVLLATNGHEGLEMFIAHRAAIALVVTDLNMPEKNGMALIADLQSLAEKLPILVSTGLSGKENTAKLKAMKIKILHKPYDADLLVEAIHEALHPA